MEKCACAMNEWSWICVRPELCVYSFAGSWSRWSRRGLPHATHMSDFSPRQCCYLSNPALVSDPHCCWLGIWIQLAARQSDLEHALHWSQCRSWIAAHDRRGGGWPIPLLVSSTYSVQQHGVMIRQVQVKDESLTSYFQREESNSVYIWLFLAVIATEPSCGWRRIRRSVFEIFLWLNRHDGSKLIDVFWSLGAASHYRPWCSCSARTCPQGRTQQSQTAMRTFLGTVSQHYPSTRTQAIALPILCQCRRWALSLLPRSSAPNSMPTAQAQATTNPSD